MKNILLIQSSPRGGESFSQKVAQSIADGFKKRHPDAQVTIRDLARNPPPHVGPAFVGGLFTGQEQRTRDAGRRAGQSGGQNRGIGFHARRY